MPELLLIRHAETDFNRQLRFQGHLDAPLNANGLAQAARLAGHPFQQTGCRSARWPKPLPSPSA